MRSCIPWGISRILGTTLLMFVLTGVVQGFYGFNSAKTLEESHAAHVREVKEMEWSMIKAVIVDNYNSAQLQSQDIKNEIQVNLLSSYGSTDSLKYDLDNPSPDSKAFKIFTQAVTDKYLNGIKNDNNDPFVASRMAILSDLSLNSATGSPHMRTWEEELTAHANVGLGEQAVEAIRTQGNRQIFWEFLPSQDANHKQIAHMDLSELKQVFLAEGVEGLQTYEFLAPAYIQQHSDILGKSDVSNTGVRQTNYKLIVLSGFNIYDILTTYHKAELVAYNNTIDAVNRDYEMRMHGNNLLLVIQFMILLFCIAATALINNAAVRILLEDKDVNVAHK